MSPLSWFSILKRLVLLPAAFYFLAFCVLTFPAIFRVSSHYFADLGDGMQMAYNLWWVNQAVTGLHQWPWHTTWLHSPEGISLYGHTLTSFNGFLAIPLLRFLPLLQTYNFLVLFSFVASGVTAFWLAWAVTGSWAGSLLAGFVFTFSNYHFAHAEGHLNLVSTEGLPLFILLFWKLLERRTLRMGIGAALVYFLVFLCDYYYALFAGMAAILMVIWWCRTQGAPWRQSGGKRALGAFGAMVAVVLSPFATGAFLAHLREGFLGGHPPEEFSLDLLAPFIPGGHWAFASLTESYWSRLPGNIHESSVSMGISVMVLLVYAWKKRHSLAIPTLPLWYWFIGVFGVLALGPYLHIAGKQVSEHTLPYHWLETVFPPLKASGVPVRMMVMVILAASVLAAIAFRELLKNPGIDRRWIAALLALLLLEYWPAPIPTTQPPIMDYAEILKDLPGGGSLFEVASPPTPPSLELFYQTLHHKPLALGYTSRTTQKGEKRREELHRRFNLRDIEGLKALGVRYVLVDSQGSLPGRYQPVHLLYHDRLGKLYDLEGIGMAPRTTIGTGTPWEELAGYSRVVRMGNIIHVAGTVASDENGQAVALGDPYQQTRYILQKIERSLKEAGAELTDVSRTRIYVTNIDGWEAVGRAHGEVFRDIRPACTMIEVSRLITPDFLVEIEADAVVEQQKK